MPTPEEIQDELERLRHLRRLMLDDINSENRRFWKYQEDPVGFCREILGEEPWSVQQDIMKAVKDHPRVAVKSCHDSGKSYIASRIVAWWIASHPIGYAFAITTAPTFKQVRNILWREIHRAHSRGGLPGKLNQTDWQVGGEVVAFGSKPADYDSEAFQGIHAPAVLVVLDEACGIPEVLIDAAETVLTSSHCRLLEIGNPDDPSAAFAKHFEPGSGYETFTIKAWDTPNFSGEDVTEAARIALLNPDWVEDKRTRWGPDSPLWISKVEAEFPKDADDALIRLSWIQNAASPDRKMPAADPVILAVDVARFGGDESIIVRRRGLKADIVWKATNKDTVAVANKARELATAYGASEIRVDEVGVGGGVVDMLNAWGEPVVPMNGGWSPSEGDKKQQDQKKEQRERLRFHNIRAEWYWQLRDRFENGLLDIPDDPDLIAQLAGLKFKVSQHGKILVESKDEMKARGLPSPDRADALMMAFAEMPVRKKRGKLKKLIRA